MPFRFVIERRKALSERQDDKLDSRHNRCCCYVATLDICVIKWNSYKIDEKTDKEDILCLKVQWVWLY